MRGRDFHARIGTVHIPEAEGIAVEPGRGLTPDPEGPLPPPIPPIPDLPPETPIPHRLLHWDPEHLIRWRWCSTTLREGCYTVSFRPVNGTLIGPFFPGTIRVERRTLGYRISGDLYRRWWFEVIDFRLERVNRFQWNSDLSDDAADTGGVIPIYPRTSYYSYLKGTGARLSSAVPLGSACTFTLTFDEYEYDHPTTGFSGSFPANPDRTIRYVLSPTGTPDYYTGNAYRGLTYLGTVSMRWVSPYFRRATLEIHKLEEAEVPAPVASGSTTENFSTIFETAGWDLSVIDGGEIELPASLSGVQDPNDCWTKPNSATLMESVPGYDPSELDDVWKARLVAIPAKLGCSRGRMFDNADGDPNDVPREGAVTHSHDGYPAPNDDFGAAEGGLQKDFPRAFLRSAAHEVGHTFNQIHQSFEGGSDNSIMTVTPSVASVLDGAGQTFPDDIDLAFNETNRQHLIHLPDPAVRPGAMEFFGAAVNAPEAEQIAWFPFLVIAVTTDGDSARLGEPVPLSWTMTNEGKKTMAVPSRLDVESLTARLSVTDPGGKITFMRPAAQDCCPHNPLQRFKRGAKVEGSTTAYWGRDGFAFETPGRHVIDVIALWQIGGAHFGAHGSTAIWIEHPTTEEDNRIAALLLDPEVGRAIALGRVPRKSRARKRIKEALKIRNHPACDRLSKLDFE